MLAMPTPRKNDTPPGCFDVYKEMAFYIDKPPNSLKDGYCVPKHLQKARERRNYELRKVREKLKNEVI